MSTHKFGIIGCGAIAVHHIEAMNHVDNAEFIAVYGVIPQQTNDFAEKNGLRAYLDLDEFLANPEIEVVTICTPSGSHAELAIKAMNAGKHVVVEKPLALNVEDCKAVIEAAKKNNRKCEVVCQLRFAEVTQAVKNAIDTGALGKIVSAGVHMKFWRSEEYYASSDWRGTWKHDGGGALMNQGIHGIDLLRYFMGSPKRISAVCNTLYHKIETEDTAAALLEYPNGAIGIIEGTTSVNPGYARRLEICGTKGSIVLLEGTVDKWDVEGLPKPDNGETKLGNASRDPNAVNWLGHARQFADIIKAIENDTDVFNGPEDGAATVELICGIYEASKKQSLVDFKSQF